MNNVLNKTLNRANRYCRNLKPLTFAKPLGREGMRKEKSDEILLNKTQ